jgi:hypothetical protein
MEMQKAQAQAQRDRDRRIPPELAEAGGDVAQAQAQVEPHALELSHQDESIDARVQQQDLVENRQVRRPRRLKPAQIDRETQDRQHQKIAPVAALGGVGLPRLPLQPGDRNREQRVQREPIPAEPAPRKRDQQIRHTQRSRTQKARGQR